MDKPVLYPAAEFVDFRARQINANRWKHGQDPYLAIVNHVTQGGHWWFIREAMKVSAHFTIVPDGRVFQGVPLDYCAWHAGAMVNPTWIRSNEVPSSNGHITLKRPSPNFVTIGIEHAGFSAPPYWLKAKKPESFAKYSKMVYGPDYPWPESMIESTIELHEWLFEHGWLDEKPSTRNIIGHNMLNTKNRPHDPGDEFWDSVYPRIMASLTNTHTTQPEILNDVAAVLDGLISEIENAKQNLGVG